LTLLHYFVYLTSVYRLGQKYENIFVHFLVQMKTLKSPFEINWPLGWHFCTLGDFRNISTIFIFYWQYQNGVNVLFLVLKPIEVTSGFILRLTKKIVRWRCCRNIWHLSLKTKISPLVVCYQEPNGCQKNQKDLRNSDLEVYCANIQPTLKILRSSTKNQSFLMASGGFLKFTQYWLNISALTQQIYF
jgi:hypothetical protein